MYIYIQLERNFNSIPLTHVTQSFAGAHPNASQFHTGLTAAARHGPAGTLQNSQGRAQRRSDI